jgi:hypothetical protein
MQAKVSGQNPFKVLKSTCAIGPTTSGYTLNYATNPEGPWTAIEEATPADEAMVVNDMTPYMWLKLDGNVDDDVELIL